MSAPYRTCLSVNTPFDEPTGHCGVPLPWLYIAIARAKRAWAAGFRLAGGSSGEVAAADFELVGANAAELAVDHDLARNLGVLACREHGDWMRGTISPTPAMPAE